MTSALRAMTPTPGQGEDPYAPPAELASTEGIPDAPHSFGWRMENGRLWVARTSRLPMIDLLNGQSDEVMQLRQIEVRYHPWWLRYLPLGAALLVLIASWVQNTGLDLLYSLLALAGGWILASVILSLLPKCNLRFFITKRTLRIQKVFERMMLISFLLIFLSSAKITQIGLSWMGLTWLNFIPIAGSTLWLVILIASFFIKRKLYCRRMGEGEFELRGLHPKARTYLESLTQSASVRSKSQAAPQAR